MNTYDKQMQKVKKIMEDAIADGLIAWHGLPFTTHSELMDTKLFEYGLSIAQNWMNSMEEKP